MSYSDNLRAINSRISTMNIKGKDYAEVNQRILAFWELFPNGRISTDVTTTDARCDCVCEVYRDLQDQYPAATGHAFEERKGQVNSTSYVENCETSAVGRALGMLGIGATKALASAEEVKAAIEQQEQHQQQPDNYMEQVREWWPHFERLFLDRNEALGNLLRNIGAKDMKNLTREQAEKAVAYMAQRYYEAQDGAQD